MSAIAGLIQVPLPDNARDLVGKMCGIQQHRNPAGNQVVQRKYACFGMRCFETTQELETLTNQSASSQSAIIASDSAIYNAEELQKSLSQKGIQFRTTTDEELILKLYDMYQQDCPKYLRGDFAFAIWDAPRHTLFLARDRFGIRPLFYSRTKDGAFLFASELKALIKTGHAERIFDLEAIYHYLFFSFFRQPQTPFVDFKSLLPGHFLSINIRDGAMKVASYWDIPYSPQKSDDEEFLIREGLSVLEESVDLRARRSSSIGVSLSGGLDSSVIAALIAKRGYPFKTFTFGFKNEGKELSEFDFASLVAKKTGSNHSEVVLSCKDLLSNLPHMVWHFDTPSAGTILPYFLAKAARQAGVDVTFRGDGAHSIFEAPVEGNFVLLHRFFSILNPLPASIRNSLFGGFECLFTSLEPRVRNRSGNLPAAIRLFGSYFQTITGRKSLDLMFSKAERKSFFAASFWKNNPHFRESSSLILEVMNNSASPNILEQLIYEEFHRFCDQAMGHITSVNAAFSIEGVQPYLDHRLVEFSQNNLPLKLRTMTLPNKYILRKISELLLPRQIVERTQHGFAMPFHIWLKNDLKPLVDDVFSETTVRKRGLFRYDTMKTLYDAYYRGSGSYISWRKLWAFIILEIWLRLYLDPPDIEPPIITHAIPTSSQH